MKEKIIKDIIEKALIEDMNNGDITTDSLIQKDAETTATFYAKETGIICGLLVCEMTFKVLDKNIKFNCIKKDGDLLENGEKIATITGNTRAILSAERVALNIMQRLSGIATNTRNFVNEISGLNTRIVDTRKTTPGLRILEKYAVQVGGGFNHRYNLSESVMIKDNHISAVGGISQAISIARKTIPHTMKIEVEVESLKQVEEAIEAGADIIMLDNMSIELMTEAVQMINKKAIVEASGNMTIDRVKSVGETGVDIISVGAITHSVKSMDISLLFEN